MAISATLELREAGAGTLSMIKGSMVDSYIVVDLDYTLKRSIDQTGRPSSIATIDFIKVTIKASKELKAPFHDWIKDPDGMKGGIIKIYDSTGFVSSAVQDVTGRSAGVDFDVVNDLATEEIEGNLNDAMDRGTKYGNHDDLFDEMSRSELLEYIASKGLDVEVKNGDSDDTIRERIRYYNKISKMGLAQLKAEASSRGVTLSENATEEDYLHALAEKNNESTASRKEPGRQPAYKTADKLKRSTSKTISSVANAAIKTMESARSITFDYAYCVSLREHFTATADETNTFDSTYPWTLEIGIKPSKVIVNGANVGGATLMDDVTFDFFTIKDQQPVAQNAGGN